MREKQKNVPKKLLAIIMVIFLLTMCSLAVRAAAEEPAAQDELAFLSEKGTRIGVGSGSIQEVLVNELYPDADIYYYDKFQGYIALEQGKLDAYIYDKKQMELAVKNGQKGVRVLDSTIGDPIRIALGISKTSAIPDLEAQVNRFIETAQADGTMDELYDRWINKGDFTMPEIERPASPKYHLTVGTTGDVEPYSFYQGETLTGFDIELMYRLAAWLDADIDFQVFSWDSIVPGLQSGKADIIASNLQISPERAAEITFSTPLYEEKNGIMVRDEFGASRESFLSALSSSFEKTFIREDRYKLFLSGIFTTLLITVLSILFGTALGFLVYMACRNGNKAANFIARIFVWLIQGMPVVVLLMILYYVIFSDANISGTAVAIVSFTLVFGAGVFGMLTTSVGAIDKGQTEAAYALGYSDLRTFFRIILPQAVPHFLPSYKGEIIGLIKATSIVGYIAVQDLTKMGDIIRGRTYEAFFPLIAVAVIYFILGGLLTFIVDRIEIGTDPKRRKKERILKGVKTND
ncbi:MAG: ABC transporter substrate-binding protein/permease [Oscillospiraceae bacterium]|nr:ABC transporter substrate-binding protein/permease [Oscillospiraceae bacterium]